MMLCFKFFFFNDTATTEIYTLSLHDALPICLDGLIQFAKSLLKVAVTGVLAWWILKPHLNEMERLATLDPAAILPFLADIRSEEHTSELQSQFHLVCRLLLEKKNT